MKPSGLIEQQGDRHWIVVDGENGRCQVVPHSLWFAAPMCVVLAIGMAIIVFFSPLIELPEKIGWAAFSLVCGGFISWFWHWFEKQQERLGPYIQLDETGVLLRLREKVPLSSQCRFTVERVQGRHVEDRREYGLLYLSWDGGEEYVLRSWEGDKVDALKELLNQKLDMLLNSVRDEATADRSDAEI